jgi:hypothetical protein
VNWERGVPDDGDLRLVRPYALTRGRTRPDGDDLPLETLVVATERGRDNDAVRLEARRIVRLCWRPLSVAEVSAHMNVPVGVARVMVGDLLADGHVAVHRPVGTTGRFDVQLLKRVLNGLQAL